MTEEELEQVARACSYVKMTAGFLPYLRRFLLARLESFPALGRQIVLLDAHETYQLWEWLKDMQLELPLLRNAAPADETGNLWAEAEEDKWTTF